MYIHSFHFSQDFTIPRLQRKKLFICYCSWSFDSFSSVSKNNIGFLQFPWMFTIVLCCCFFHCHRLSNLFIYNQGLLIRTITVSYCIPSWFLMKQNWLIYVIAASALSYHITDNFSGCKVLYIKTFASLIDWSINQSLSQSQSVDQSANSSISQSVSQSNKQTNSQSINPSIHLFVYSFIYCICLFIYLLILRMSIHLNSYANLYCRNKIWMIIVNINVIPCYISLEFLSLSYALTSQVQNKFFHSESCQCLCL